MAGSALYQYILRKIVQFLSRYPFVIMVVGIAYLVIPVDLIPEVFTGLLGYIDDILVLFFGIHLMRKFKDTRVPAPSVNKPTKSPYEILEISRGASQKEIKEAFRKRMAEYHPDKVAHLGKDLKDTAAQKTREIQKAYDNLKR